MPLVSVCIPTYNRAEKLKRAIHAVMTGSYSNVEIVISDNASSDETAAVCEVLTKLDSRVKYFRHAENQGPTKNFEFARSKANGKYFLWHGDDDYIDADYIAQCVNELERDPELVLVSGLSAYHRANGEFVNYGNLIQPSSTVVLLRVLKYLWCVRDNSIFCGAYRSAGVRDSWMPNCLAGDWAWMSCVLSRGRAKVMPSIHVHREYEDTTSSSIARIVSVIGAPHWHARFPWLAMALNVAGHYANYSYKHRDRSHVARIFNYISIFSLLTARGLFVNIRVAVAKFPFAKFLYKILSKKNLRI